MRAQELARLVREAHRRITERRVQEYLHPNVYEPIRLAFWEVLLERAAVKYN